MITDEGASFLGDLKSYETKHESYISLLNQLFDGKGDKMTLAKNVERPVPRNSTSLSVGVQQKSFCEVIFSLTETLWLDNGFGERFIFSAAKPYRYNFIQNFFIRWFKFTLKPPNRITGEKLRLAIWDTSFWNFWVKFGHNGPWDIS